MGTNIPEISPVDIWGEEVEIIDAYGTWGQYKEVLYDIMGMDERALFKHVIESDVRGFQEISKGVEIIEGHLVPDHIHMLISIAPKISVSSFMV